MGSVLRIILLLMALTLFGAFGFMLIEEWGFLDSLYMAVITITTVGFEEIRPLSGGGRIFVIAYLALGIGVFFYGIVQIGEIVLRAQFGEWLGRRKLEKAIKTMKNHLIICGFGRMGRQISRQLAAKGLPFVVIDREEEALSECREEGWTWILGDATDDRVLEEAGVTEARGLATVLPSDADNVYVILSARLLSPKIQIIARAGDEKSVVKMERAGANRVVSLYATGAMKIAHFLIHPSVERFLEVITAEGRELDLAEVHVTERAPYAGKALMETDFSSQGIIIVGIRRPGGELLLPPPSAATLDPGDLLIALGKAEAIENLIQR